MIYDFLKKKIIIKQIKKLIIFFKLKSTVIKHTLKCTIFFFYYFILLLFFFTFSVNKLYIKRTYTYVLVGAYKTNFKINIIIYKKKK